MTESPVLARQIVHGYGSFSRGLCKCFTCRLAGAEYRRNQRAKRLEYLIANPDDAAHGLRASYDCGCRCSACVIGRSAKAA